MLGQNSKNKQVQCNWNGFLDEVVIRKNRNIKIKVIMEVKETIIEVIWKRQLKWFV